jgi:hypothetical protein
VGEILVGAPLGDFHLAPGSVNVEEDEPTDRPVVAIFAIAALELARLARIKSG